MYIYVLIAPCLLCKITADGQKSYVSSVIADGQLETLMEVHCLVETPQSRRKHAKQNLDVFVDAYTISISYDRKNFGEEFDYVVIDSLCQSSDNITGEISLKVIRFYMKMCCIFPCPHNN